jgi:hypothetical protein
LSFDETKSQRIQYIKEKIGYVNEEYDKFMNNDLSVEQFWNELKAFLRSLTEQREYSKIIGTNASENLRNSLINLNTYWNSYSESKSLGQTVEANALERDIRKTMDEVIQKLGSLNLEPLVPPKINTRDTVPPKIKSPQITRFLRSKYILIGVPVGFVIAVLILSIAFYNPGPIPKHTESSQFNCGAQLDEFSLIGPWRWSGYNSGKFLSGLFTFKSDCTYMDTPRTGFSDKDEGTFFLSSSPLTITLTNKVTGSQIPYLITNPSNNSFHAASLDQGTQLDFNR